MSGKTDRLAMTAEQAETFRCLVEAADQGEALRLSRLAVEQGEPKAQPEVERLEASVSGGSEQRVPGAGGPAGPRDAKRPRHRHASTATSMGQ